MVKSIVIKQNDSYEVIEMESCDLDKLQSIVDGYIEWIDIDHSNSSGYYINEEGKFNKEMNNLATKWWHWNLLKVRESLTGFNDYISGDVVYTKLDETGAECSLSDEEIEEFKLFTIAYQTMTQSQKEN